MERSRESAREIKVGNVPQYVAGKSFLARHFCHLSSTVALGAGTWKFFGPKITCANIALFNRRRSLEIMRQNFQAEQLEKFSLDNCLRCLERTSRRHTENIRFGNGCSRISHLNSEIKFNNKKYIIFTFKIEYVICTDFKILYYNIASPIFHF